MCGGFSKELIILCEKLLNFILMIELELDFSEEDVEFVDCFVLCWLVDEIEEVIVCLVNLFSVGNVIKNGVLVVIIGEINVGKLILLNVLLNEDKVIVSDIYGIIWDVIEDIVNIGGIIFCFIDIVGIWEISDMIESLGIEWIF